MISVFNSSLSFAFYEGLLNLYQCILQAWHWHSKGSSRSLERSLIVPRSNPQSERHYSDTSPADHPKSMPTYPRAKVLSRALSLHSQSIPVFQLTHVSPLLTDSLSWATCWKGPGLAAKKAAGPFAFRSFLYESCKCGIGFAAGKMFSFGQHCGICWVLERAKLCFLQERAYRRALHNEESFSHLGAYDSGRINDWSLHAIFVRKSTHTANKRHKLARKLF